MIKIMSCNCGFRGSPKKYNMLFYKTTLENVNCNTFFANMQFFTKGIRHNLEKILLFTSDKRFFNKKSIGYNTNLGTTFLFLHNII